LAYIEAGDLLQSYKQNGIEIIQIYETKISQRRFKSALKLLKSLIILSKLNFDVVYVNQVDDLPLASLIKLILGCRLVCHLRLPPPTPSSILTSKLKQIGLSSGSVDQYIVATKKSFDNYIAAGLKQEKLVVIPNGFMVEKYINIKPKEFSTISKITYIGRIDRQKGIHDLIDAFNILLHYHPLLHLNVAGAPTRSEQFSYKMELKAKIMEYDLDEKITFVGQVDSPIEYLATQDICIFPSIKDESFGRVLVESLLAYTPIICRDIGSVREIIDDSEGEWIFLNIDEMVMVINKYIENPQRFNIKKRRESAIKNYDIRHVILEIENALSSPA